MVALLEEQDTDLKAQLEKTAPYEKEHSTLFDFHGRSGCWKKDSMEPDFIFKINII